MISTKMMSGWESAIFASASNPSVAVITSQPTFLSSVTAVRRMVLLSSITIIFRFSKLSSIVQLPCALRVSVFREWLFNTQIEGVLSSPFIYRLFVTCDKVSVCVLLYGLTNSPSPNARIPAPVVMAGAFGRLVQYHQIQHSTVQ